MVVSTSVNDRLERLVSEMTCNVLMRTLSHAHSLIHSLTQQNMRPRTNRLDVEHTAQMGLGPEDGLIITLRASDAAAQCIVIGPVCGFVCVCVFVGVFMGLLPR